MIPIEQNMLAEDVYPNCKMSIGIVMACEVTEWAMMRRGCVTIQLADMLK